MSSYVPDPLTEAQAKIEELEAQLNIITSFAIKKETVHMMLHKQAAKFIGCRIESCTIFCHQCTGAMDGIECRKNEYSLYSKLMEFGEAA